MSSNVKTVEGTVDSIWKAHGLQFFALKPLNSNESEEEEQTSEELDAEDDNLDLQNQENGSNELSPENIQEVLSMNETLQQQVQNLQQLVLNMSQGQQMQPQQQKPEEKPKKSFQAPSLDMTALEGLTEDEQALAHVLAKILPGYLQASIEPVMEQVSSLEDKHGRLETSNEQSKINSEVNRVFSTYPDAFTLQNKMVSLANNPRYATVAKDPEALYWIAKGQAAGIQARPKPQPKRMGGGKPNTVQPSNTKPVKAKTPGDALNQAFEQNPEIRKRLRNEN
jgi:hypothetical protein